jgi:hypothetical protein
MFAGIVLAYIGILNVLCGIAAVGHSRQRPAEPHLRFGSLHWWGWACINAIGQKFFIALTCRGRWRSSRMWSRRTGCAPMAAMPMPTLC